GVGKGLAFLGRLDSHDDMIRSGFLSEEDRKALIALARDGSSLCRVTRRANALVLLDDGMSCQQVARVLLFDDDTIRGWYWYEVRGSRQRPFRRRFDHPRLAQGIRRRWSRRTRPVRSQGRRQPADAPPDRRASRLGDGGSADLDRRGRAVHPRPLRHRIWQIRADQADEPHRLRLEEA